LPFPSAARADQIVSPGPLGGVAYVRAAGLVRALVLWSIVAGPLVNFVLLFPPTVLMWYLRLYVRLARDHHTRPVSISLRSEPWGNAVLLVFNLLPIYPRSDGGQILHAPAVVRPWPLAQPASGQRLLAWGWGASLFYPPRLLASSVVDFQRVAAQPSSPPFIIFSLGPSASSRSRTVLSLLELPRHDDCGPVPTARIGPPEGRLLGVRALPQTRFRPCSTTHGKCPRPAAPGILNPRICPPLAGTTNHIDRWFQLTDPWGVALEASGNFPSPRPAQSPPT